MGGTTPERRRRLLDDGIKISDMLNKKDLQTMRRHAIGIISVIDKKLPLTPVCVLCYISKEIADRCVCDKQ